MNSRLAKSFEGLRLATNKNRLARAMRIWVQTTPKIHGLNYWYYRWFTNEFELWLIDYLEEK